MYFKNVDGQITELYVRYDKQQEVMSRLHESVVALPMLVTQLEQATDLLGLYFLVIQYIYLYKYILCILVSVTTDY